MNGLLFIGLALLFAIVSLPMLYRKIPMNRFYGARFPQSFKSDEHWYEINCYGGKALLIACIPIALFGLVGLLFGTSSDSYTLTGVAVMLVSIVMACGCNYLQARRVDKNFSNNSE